jgi:hypothetical protein
MSVGGWLVWRHLLSQGLLGGITRTWMILETCSSETSVNNYQTTRYHNPDDQYVIHHHRQKPLKSHTLPHPARVLSLHFASCALSGMCMFFRMALFQLRFFLHSLLWPRDPSKTISQSFWMAYSTYPITIPYHTEYLTQFPRSSDGLWHMWQCGRKFVKWYYRVYNGLPLEPILSQTKSIHALMPFLLNNHCRWVSKGVKSDY